MFATSMRYRKCSYATYCPLQNPQLLSENEGDTLAEVRYLCEVDERLGVLVRLYAVVESSLKTITADMLIEQIRSEILPFDRTFGEHPVNNIGNDPQLASLLGTTLMSIHRRCSQFCGERKEDMPNVGIAVIRGRIILCGILGNVVFALPRKNADTYARRAGSQQYTLFSNCDVPMALKVSNFVNTCNFPVNLYVHEIQPSDLRFFMFTMESVRMLLKAVPSLALFTKPPDDITWSLYIWQTRMYFKNPQEVPAAGFILVDELAKLIADNGTCLGQNFTEKLLKSNEKNDNNKEQKPQARDAQKQQPQKLQLKTPPAATPGIPKGPEKPMTKSQRNVYLQMMLKQIREKYTKITTLVVELHRKERDEMLAYMKRDEQILNIQKEYGQEKMVRDRLQDLQQQQKKHLDELRVFLRKVLKYQDIVRCELLLNVEKLEQTLDAIKQENDTMLYLRETFHHHQRMQRVILFQTKITQNLEILQKQMKEISENGCAVQSKLTSFASQVQQGKRWPRLVPAQIFWKGGSGTQHYRASNQQSYYGGGGSQQQQWRRRPNSGMFRNNNYNKGH